MGQPGRPDQPLTGFPDHLKSERLYIDVHHSTAVRTTVYKWRLYLFLYHRYELSGHRGTITRVIFHPTYRYPLLTFLFLSLFASLSYNTFLCVCVCVCVCVTSFSFSPVCLCPAQKMPLSRCVVTSHVPLLIFQPFLLFPFLLPSPQPSPPSFHRYGTMRLETMKRLSRVTPIQCRTLPSIIPANY